MAHGEMGHFEIPADDADRARKFYSELFGWQFQDETEGFEGYHMFRSGPGQVGGAIGQRGVMSGQNARQYVSVDSIDDAVAKVADLGGEVVDPKVQVGDMGWSAVVRDSEGGEIGLWEDAAAPATPTGA